MEGQLAITLIVISCDPEFYTEEDWQGIENAEFFFHFVGNNLCVERLACRAISASSAFLLTSFVTYIYATYICSLRYLLTAIHAQFLVGIKSCRPESQSRAQIQLPEGRTLNGRLGTIRNWN